MKKSICGLSALVASVVLADPAVKTDSVVAEQAADRSVTVSYELENESAVVTVDFLTNGVSIGEINFTRLSGDVNRLVGVGKHSLLWVPDRDWQEVLPDVAFTANVTAWKITTPPDYMVVDLCASNTVRYYTSTNALPYGGLANDVYRSEKMVFLKCPAANVTWRMGSSTDSSEKESKTRTADNEVPHLVTLTEDFYMAVFELTVAQYRQFVLDADIPERSTSSSPHRNDASYEYAPVGSVSYDTIRGTTKKWPENLHEVDGTSFIGQIRSRSGMDSIDLPTDAQWEFACRAGVGTQSGNFKYWDDWEALYTPKAWYKVNSGSVKHKVGGLDPNGWGLYDMQGNMYELCLDYWSTGSTFSDGSSVTDPKGPSSQAEGRRVVRNGYYASGSATDRKSLRCANRAMGYKSEAGHEAIGFRLCAEAIAK